jgi:nitric oxide reductase NorD protein
VRPARAEEEDARPGAFVVKASASEQGVEDPLGLVRPADRAATPDADELADSLAELPEARLVSSPGLPREILLADEPLPRGARRPGPPPLPAGLAYPEWDYQRAAYRTPGAVVRERPAPVHDSPWLDRVLARQRPLVREVRRRFEQLRLERLPLRRQSDGPELDLDAYVTQLCDRRAGCAPDERLHRAARPLRRDLTLAVLVDASASTDAFLSQARRVIDVEKEALLLLCAALQGLALPAAVLAFSGEGAGDVSVLVLKEFRESVSLAVERRIAALEPDRYTRAGAAIRHASARLAREPARRRLLLLLSDGKPNDVDRYAGRHGIEDTRQAIVEARLQGLDFFCVTADRRAPDYATHLFGRGAFAVLPFPERLPRVLIALLRRLVAS